MRAYNAKITMEGKYLPFYGWSTVALVDNDNMVDGSINFIENYINNTPVLAKYFSALPADSYHVTVCNIWSNGRPLLEHQKNFLLQNYSIDDARNFYEQSQQIGFFNPDWCMNNLLEKLQKVIPSEGVELIIEGVYFSGSTMGISFSSNSDTTKLDKCRDDSRRVAEINEGIIPYHLTLAYNYKNVDVNEITPKLQELNSMLSGKKILLMPPIVSYFSDMKKFIPYTLASDMRSNETPAPPF
jgi:hypothetical protein